MADIPGGLGPLLETGGQLTVIAGVFILAWRILLATWTQASQTLTESANYARSETGALRARIDVLESEASLYHLDRAKWLIDQATLINRIAALEATVTRLTSHANPEGLT